MSLGRKRKPVGGTTFWLVDSVVIRSRQLNGNGGSSFEAGGRCQREQLPELPLELECNCC